MDLGAWRLRCVFGSRVGDYCDLWFKAPMPRTHRLQTAGNRRWVPGICIFLIAITWAIFGQTLGHEFINYDDDTYVYKNPAITGGITLHGLIWAFTHSHSGNWHPLTTISHMLDCQLYGLQAWGHHLTNLLLHSVAVVLLFLVLRQMTASTWKSTFVATLFAIHPLHVESVAWIAERKDMLSGMFFMLTLGAYVNYARQPLVTRYAMMSILFACGLMSKPMLVTLPFVLLLLDYWPLHRFGSRGSSRRLVLEKIPLLMLSAISCVATVLVQRSGLAPVSGLPLVARVNNAFVTYILYIWQMIWPARLAVFYPHPENELALWQVILAIGLLILITAIAIVLRRKHSYLMTGWLWYLGMLAPVIGVIQVGFQARADRYTYLPHIGLYLMATWGVADLFPPWQYRSRILGAIASATIVALSWCSAKQASYWRNSESLWTHTLAVTSPNPIAHNNLGNYLLEHDRLEEAIDHFQMSVNIRPSYAEGENNLGVALTKQGRTDEAIAHLKKVLELNPDDDKAYYNLGNVFLQKGELDEAIAAYQKGLATQPNYAEAHYNLGIALAKKGEPNPAIAQFEQAVQAKPDYAQAYYMLGNSFFEKGQFDGAVAQYRQALKIQSDYPEVQNNIALALLKKGEVAEAIGHWEKLLVSRPDFLDALNNLAWVLATSPESSVRNGSKAVALAEQAQHLSGEGNPGILRTLAAAYAENGRFTDAIDIAQRGADSARAQGDAGLAEIFQADTAFYRVNQPLRTAGRPGDHPRP
jgi:protein O-mannosyl-transferase